MKLSSESKTAIQKIADLLEQASAEFQKLSDVEQQLVYERHNEGSSLNHCLRWGGQACEEILVGSNRATVKTTSGVEIDADDVHQWILFVFGKNFLGEKSSAIKQQMVDAYAENAENLQRNQSEEAAGGS